MRYIAYCFLTVVMLCSCTKIPSDVQKVLQAAGPNRKELRSVIKHYIALQDSLKLNNLRTKEIIVKKAPLIPLL